MSKRVKFWSRISREKSQEWVLVEGVDESDVPLKAWKAFNKAFWKWKTNGLLYPLDELDAYQFAAGELVKTAGKLVGSRVPRDRIPETTKLSLDSGMRASGTLAPTVLHRASPTTYLVAAAYKSLMKYRDRQVKPVRKEYRAIGNTARVPVGSTLRADRDARGEDRADREWSDKAATTLDVTAFVEALPGVHSFAHFNAMRLAAVCIAETLERLDTDTQRGLRAWLDADGVWIDAAKIYGCSRPWYCELFKHRWAPAFRRACVWVW